MIFEARSLLSRSSCKSRSPTCRRDVQLSSCDGYGSTKPPCSASICDAATGTKPTDLANEKEVEALFCPHVAAVLNVAAACVDKLSCVCVRTSLALKTWPFLRCEIDHFLNCVGFVSSPPKNIPKQALLVKTKEEESGIHWKSYMHFHPSQHMSLGSVLGVMVQSSG